GGRAADAAGRGRRGGARGDRDGAPPALPRQRADRRPQGAALTLRPAPRELRRGGRVPPGGCGRLHPAGGSPAPAPHPRGTNGQVTRSRARGRAAKAWAGRTATPTAPAVERFTGSLPVDRRLYPHDIAGSVAHARALVRARLLTRREGARLEAGLAAVRRELDRGRFRFLPSDQDIHMAIDRRLVDGLGSLGGKRPTRRSRTGRVALDLRPCRRAARYSL